MSQEELAKKIGYKSRSSINKIELDLYNLKQSKIKCMADALDTTPAYIMGWTDDAEEWRSAFREYLSNHYYRHATNNVSQSELDHWQAIAEGSVPLTFKEACNIANKLGLSIDKMIRITEVHTNLSEGERYLSIPDAALEADIKLADDDLIDIVHKICGMDDLRIHEAIASGKLYEIYNPKKIELVKDFIEDNEKTLRKMIDLMDK